MIEGLRDFVDERFISGPFFFVFILIFISQGKRDDDWRAAHFYVCFSFVFVFVS